MSALDRQIELARLSLESAARSFHHPQLGDIEGSQSRLNNAALHLSKLLDKRDFTAARARKAE